MKINIVEGKDTLSTILNRVEHKSSSFVTVGVHGFEDSELLLYAMANEFGAKNIPSRPFIRQTYDKNNAEIILKGQEIAVLVRDGKIEKTIGLQIWGEFFLSLIQKEINEGTNFEENKESTIKRKGGGKSPLQDSGRLQNSIKAVVG